MPVVVYGYDSSSPDVRRASPEARSFGDPVDAMVMRPFDNVKHTNRQPLLSFSDRKSFVSLPVL
jgi:hypothetical protein